MAHQDLALPEADIPFVLSSLQKVLYRELQGDDVFVSLSLSLLHLHFFLFFIPSDPWLTLKSLSSCVAFRLSISRWSRCASISSGKRSPPLLRLVPYPIYFFFLISFGVLALQWNNTDQVSFDVDDFDTPTLHRILRFVNACRTYNNIPFPWSLGQVLDQLNYTRPESSKTEVLPTAQSRWLEQTKKNPLAPRGLYTTVSQVSRTI